MINERTTSPSRASISMGDVLALIWAFLALGASLALLGLGVSLLVGPSTASRTVGAILALIAGAVIAVRYVRLLIAVFRDQAFKRACETMEADLVQFFLLIILATVLFPIVWILSLSLDPRDLSRPMGLSIIPPGATLEAYKTVLIKPSPNPVTFLQLLCNSLLTAGGSPGRRRWHGGRLRLLPLQLSRPPGGHAGLCVGADDSTRRPWEPVNADYEAVNVAGEASDPGSLLSHYRRLIHLRNEHAALRRGDLLPLQGAPSGECKPLYGYLRHAEDESLLVILNFAAEDSVAEDSAAEDSAAQEQSGYALSLPASDLAPGDYALQELLTGVEFDGLTVDESGVFTNYVPAETLPPRAGYILLISAGL